MFGALGADKYHEYCRDIRESGQYLLDVINDILDMSKIEAGRLKLDFEDVELDRSLADALRVVTTRAQDKHLKVDLAHRARHPLQGRPARAQADRAQPAVQRREVHARSGRITVRGAHVARRRGDRHPGHRHRHSQRARCRSSVGRSSRSKASSPRPTTAPALGLRSPNRWSSCTAARCASVRRRASARAWSCACRAVERRMRERSAPHITRRSSTSLSRFRYAGCPPAWPIGNNASCDPARSRNRVRA